MAIEPNAINNDDSPFLFQQTLYVGLGAEQYEVGERFRKNETDISELKSAQQTSETNQSQAANRLDTIESALTELAGIDVQFASLITNNHDTITAHVGNANIHVTELIRTHPNNTDIHVPTGGSSEKVLSANDSNVPVWKAFNDLLPQKLKDILAAGGVVSADDVISAFQQITVTSWTLSGSPLGVTRIKDAVFAYDRFVVGGSDGRVASSFGATWTTPVTLFDEPYPAAVEALAYDTSNVGDLSPLIALDAYSDFRISMNRVTWCNRLSVLVEEVHNIDGTVTYKDRYETADFTAAVADRGLYVLFTSKGTVYRATKEAVIAEYERATAPPEIDDNGIATVFDRHSTVWQMQESNESITQGVLSAAVGGIYFVTVGTLGRIAVSQNANIWENATSVFGASNINSVAAGFDRFMAVGNEGKIGYALFTSPKQWTLLGTPFGNENLRKIIYGSNIWLVVSEFGNVKYSRNNGETWETPDVGMQSGGTALAFGDTYFIIGDEIGSVRKSLSVASLFSVVTRSEFAALSAEILGLTQTEIAKVDSWIANYTSWFSQQLERIDEALSYQLTLSDEIPMPPTLGGSAGKLTIEEPVLDDDGNPVLDDNDNPVTITKPNNKAAAEKHSHPNDTLALLEQLHRATIPAGYDSYGKPIFPQRSHLWGIPILDLAGKIFAENQTWQRGQANGIAPLDENGIIPASFLAAGWLFETMIAAIRDQMLLEWTIQHNTIFQDLGEFSRINAFAYNKNTIVAVGEKGKIAWGPNTALMQMVTNSPFNADDSLVGVAYGTNNAGEGIFVAVSQTHYSTSFNGSEWTDAVLLSDGIQGVFYGGGFFLIPDVHGNIWRSDWTNGLSFLQQESSQNVTMGIMSFAYLQNKFVGVGTNNRLVGATDPAYWNEEQSPAPADSQWNCVFVGDGFFVAVGNYGRAVKGTITGQWSNINTGTAYDLHFGFYDCDSYIVTGKNGTLRTSFNSTVWVARDSKTTSTIRAAGYHTERYFVGTDSGQFIVSRSVGDVFDVVGDVGVGPSNDDPEPLADNAFPGMSNNYARAGHIHPNTGLITVAQVGIATTYKTVDDVVLVNQYGIPYLNEHKKIPEDFMPWQRGVAGGIASLDENGHVPDTELNKGNPNGVASLNENGHVPDTELNKGQPNGVAPLGADNIVPDIHLPPMEIDINQIINVVQSGVSLKFLQQISPFPQGIDVSSIIHGGVYGKGIYVLVGESGVGWSNNAINWKLSDVQPFGNVPVIGAAFGKDAQDKDIFVIIDTTNRISLSSNGKDWSVPYLVEGNYDFEDICYYNHTFLILCSDGEILRLTISNNNITYEEQDDSPNITEHSNGIKGGNGIVVTVGNDGKICTATDASHFVPIISPAIADLLSIAFGGGVFLIGGENNTLIIGTNRTDFRKINSPFTGNAAITGTGYDSESGLYVVTNIIGEVATSSDLIEWAIQVPKPTTARIKAIVTGDNRIILGDNFGNIFVSKVLIKINYPGISEEYVKKAYVDLKFQEILDIATGAQIGIVFENTAQLDAWIAGTYTRPDGTTPADLKIGTAIFIIATEEPDYWWDGETYIEQEDKVNINLDGYATEEYVDQKIKTINLGDAKNVWIGGNVTQNENGTINAQKVNSGGIPVGEIIRNIKPIFGSINVPEGGGNSSTGGGGFRQIYVDRINGNNNNDGLSAETAYETLSQCEAVLQAYKNAEIRLLNFNSSSSLELTSDGTADIIFVGDLTVNHIMLNGFRSVQFKGTVATSSMFLISCNNVRFYNTVNITATATSPESIFVEATDAYFYNIVSVTSSLSNLAVTFVGATRLSILRFIELVIEDTGLNDNSEYYKIERGSEVYVDGRAKHLNPYVADIADPNIYVFPTI